MRHGHLAASLTHPGCPPRLPQYTTKGDNASEAQALVDFARGLAGGAPVPRSKFLFDALDLPQAREQGRLAAGTATAGLAVSASCAAPSAQPTVPPPTHVFPPPPPPPPFQKKKNSQQVVNHMAAQTLLLNQDRCTKNFYIYRDLASQQWSMFPWDVESGEPPAGWAGRGPAATC